MNRCWLKRLRMQSGVVCWGRLAHMAAAQQRQRAAGECGAPVPDPPLDMARIVNEANTVLISLIN